jgi:hypothetical protein
VYDEQLTWRKLGHLLIIPTNVMVIFQVRAEAGGVLIFAQLLHPLQCLAARIATSVLQPNHTWRAQQLAALESVPCLLPVLLVCRACLGACPGA